MTKLQAIKILSEITPEEALKMEQKIEKAALRVKKRNPGKVQEGRSLRWKSRNTSCPNCGQVHAGIRCPTSSALQGY